MIDSLDFSIWIFLSVYLFSFIISALILQSLDFNKIVKKGKENIAVLLYWLIVIFFTYIISQVFFDFINIII